jgi:hypothetical protein
VAILFIYKELTLFDKVGDNKSKGGIKKVRYLIITLSSVNQPCEDDRCGGYCNLFILSDIVGDCE